MFCNSIKFGGYQMKMIKAEGIIVPIVTPFKADGALDQVALRRQVRRLIQAGVSGLFTVGTSGEFWSLQAKERDEILEIVLDEADGSLPVYAGTGAISTHKSIEQARRAEMLGADAAVVITPFYVSLSQGELYAHYAAIADSINIPVFPYNNPKRTGGLSLATDTVVALAAAGCIAGIKESSGNLALTAQFINATPDDFAVFQGSDDLILPSLMLGAVGGIAATGNVAPDMVVELYKVFQAGDWDRARYLQKNLAELRRATGLGTYPAAIKAAMTMVGESAGPPRSPVSVLTGSELDVVRKVVTNLGLLAHT
jgi:4-hydroxy-tetrahydrodipicolinate synthase